MKIWVIALLLGACFASGASGYTMQEVTRRGYLSCGVSTGTPGFSTVDSKGVWSGFDVDFCRAVAVATLGDSSKVEFVPLAGNEAYTALLTGKIDLLSRQAEWTFTRDSSLSVHFAGISFYDSQGILVRNKHQGQTLKEMGKMRVCVAVDTDEEKRLKDYSDRNQLHMKFVPYESWERAIKSFGSSCEAISLKKSRLYGVRQELKNPESAKFLSEVITKEPLGPVVRQGDDVWFNVVKWTLFAMINGEELGITSKNTEEMKISNHLEIRRFFGLDGSGSRGVGLKNNWAAEIIRQVGNYGEVFERNLGAGSAVTIERGMNRLWKDGGLLYAPPLR